MTAELRVSCLQRMVGGGRALKTQTTLTKEVRVCPCCLCFSATIVCVCVCVLLEVREERIALSLSSN